MIVVDTSVVVAYMNRADDHHEVVCAWLDRTDEQLVTTPLVVAEMDYLVMRFGGSTGARALWRDLTDGAYGVEWWSGALHEAVEIAERHAALGIGLADASLVALAARLKTARMATLDERHFRRLTPTTDDKAFVLLPADET